MPPTPFFDLLDALSSLNVDKFAPFKVITADYKTIGNGSSAIQADVLIPKTLLADRQLSTRPVIVRIHGGFLVTGSSRYPPWFSNWILDYAIRHGAVIISPNYRLLPEVSGKEILEDIHDFWNWLRKGSVEQLLRNTGHFDIVPDPDQAMVVGESAGGYLAIQLALSYPLQIRAVIAAYPMIDLRSRFYTESYPKPIVGVPNISNTVVEKHTAMLSVTSKFRLASITAADPPNRLELAFAIVQNGRFLEFFGATDRSLFPIDRVEDLAAAGVLQVPPMFIFHGEQDSAVPVGGSRRFVRYLREKAPGSKVKLCIQNGDHGFDLDATLETPWLKEGLEMVSKAWLDLDCMSHL